MKWEEVRLGDVIQIKHGWAFRGKYFSDNGKYILLTPGNFFEEGGFRLRENKEKFYLGDFPKGYLLKKDDLIIAMTEQGAGLLGSPAMIPENEQFLHNQRLGLFHQYNEKIIFKKYLYYLFFTKKVRGLIAGSATGTKVKHTAPKRIYDITVKLPPLKTQKKIAKILSNYDNLIENNLKQIKLLEEKARLTYEEWFLRFRVDGVELEIDSDSGLPFGWEIKKLEELCAITSSKRIFLSDYVENGIPFYRGKEISIKSKNSIVSNEYFISEKKFEEIDKKFGSPKSNDILITAVGTLGSIYLVKNSDGKFYFKDGNLIWLKEFIEEDYYYLFYLLKSESYQEHINAIAIGSSQKALTIKALNGVKIKYPKREMILNFNHIVEPINRQIENLTLQNQNLKEARDILLPRLMTGVIES